MESDKRGKSTSRGGRAIPWLVTVSAALAGLVACTAVGCGGDDSTGGSADSDGSAPDAATIDGSRDATTNDASTKNDAAACPGAQNLCAGECVSIDRDPQNCGACGTTCAAGELCASGKCATSCSASQTKCDGDAGAFCTNEKTDNANCGGCGIACPAGEACSGGACVVSCGGGLVQCSVDGGVGDAGDGGGSAYCANENSDNANCGGCGIVCAPGTACTNGACETSCGSSSTKCEADAGTDGGEYCANEQTDNMNCGGCGVACTAGQVCTGGACDTTCQPGQVQCGSSCVDPSTSITNCGATDGCGVDGGVSGTACPENYACVSGTCTKLSKLSPGDTTRVITVDGWSIRCAEWSGSVCVHPQVEMDCSVCAAYANCGAWHDITIYNDGSQRTSLNFCAMATLGDSTVVAEGSGATAAAPQACGWYAADHPICSASKATFVAPGVPDPNLGFNLEPTYCSSESTLLTIQCNW